MLNRLRRWLCPDLAIDLGTANTLVSVQGRGIVLDEPSVGDVAGDAKVALTVDPRTIAAFHQSRRVRAIGSRSHVMLPP